MIKVHNYDLSFIINHLIAIIIFTGLYYNISMFDSSSFNHKLSIFDALYYSTTTQSTIGYGDITPLSVPAKTVALLQMFSIIGLITFHFLN